jgi:hypothetical protein
MTTIITTAPAQRFSDPPRCQHCHTLIRSGTRRPRLFCDRPGCRQAASRERRKPAPKPAIEEFCDTEQAWLRMYRAPENIAPAAKSVRRPTQKPQQNQRPLSQNSDLISDARSKLPLTIFGSGYRWPGAHHLSPRRIAAAIDAEIGTPGDDAIVSPDGIVSHIIPCRAARAT